MPVNTNTTAAGVLLLALTAVSSGHAAEEYLKPPYRPNPSTQRILEHVKPGNDAFPLEKPAEAIGDRLAELGRALRQNVSVDIRPRFLSETFQGAALGGARAASVSASAFLTVTRAEGLAAEPDAARFAEEWSVFLRDFAKVETAEFNVLKIEAAGADAAHATVDCDFDLVGPGREAARVQKVGLWKMDWDKDAQGAWRITRWTTVDAMRSSAKAPVFTEASATAFGAIPSYHQQLVPSIDYWRTHVDGVFMPDVLGHNGISAGDYDGDGWDDLYVAQPAALPNRLYRNTHDGRFEDVTEAAGVGLLDATSTGLFADVDNDGDQDLVVITFTQPLLYLNDGKGRFTQKPRGFRFTDPPKGYLTSAAIADYDRDGFLDVYVCVYSFFLGEGKYGLPSPYHDALNGPPNILFKNDGLGGFVDATKETIVGGNDRFSFAAAWGDYDGDGWLDLQVANDFGRKNLYRSSGKSAAGKITLTDVAAAAGVEDDASAGMSTAFLDYDRDGRLDIYFGNMWAPSGIRVTHAPSFLPNAPAKALESFRRHARGNTLYRNLGDGKFEDVSVKAGAVKGRWAWSSDALDFDSDGWEDLLVVNGLVSNEDAYSLDSFFWRQTVAESPLDRKPKKAFEDGWKTINKLLRAHGTQAGWERNVLLRNDGRGGFDHVEGTAGLDLAHDGRAFAMADFDHDGDPDVALMSRSGPRLRLMRNDYAGRGAAVVLHLTGKTSNRDAIGARVTVEAGGSRQMKVVQAGGGFLSQHAKALHFGLGDAGSIERVVVRWPNGQEQTLTGVPADQHVWIEEGAAAVVRSEPFTKTPEVGKTAIMAHAFDYRGTWLYAPYPAPDFSATDTTGQKHTLAQYRPKPVLLQMVTSGGSDCGEAVRDLEAQRAAIEAAGAKVLVLAMDGPSSESRIRAFAQGRTVPVLLAGEDAILSYSVLHRYLFDRQDDIVLPSAFLVDAKGELVKVYRGRVPASQMAADVPRIVPATADERLARAVPFPGKFVSTPPGRNHFQFGIEFSLQGQDAPALAAFEKHLASGGGDAISYQNVGTLYAKKGQTLKARAAFEKALALQADYPEASNSLGALLAQSGDVAGAVLQFQKALKGKPDYADAMNNLGYAYLQTGRETQALALFQSAVKIEPNLAEAYNNLGIFYGQQDDLAKAESFFRTASQKKPRYSEALNNLAMVVAALGRAAEATRLLQGSIQDDPAFEMSYVTLCKIYLEANRPREATQVLERLLQRNPKHPIGLQMLEQLKGGK